jgi:hypothetical protein
MPHPFASFDGRCQLWVRVLCFSCWSWTRGSAFLCLCFTGLSYFSAQLVDLSVVGVVKVLDALLPVGAFKLHVCSGGVALGRKRCHVAAEARSVLTGAIQSVPGTHKLVLDLLKCVLGPGCALRLYLGAAFSRAGAPFCLGTGVFLRLGPFRHRVTFLLELLHLPSCGLKVGPQFRRLCLGLLPVGRSSCLNLGELRSKVFPVLACGVQLGSDYG